MLVEGDAGVGKTRLVQEFADRARRGGATVLAGGCLQLEADNPYAPIDEALDALPDKPVFGSGFANRAGQFRRVADAIAGAGRPVVLVLEDLHWADASTRDLFVYLQRALRQAPVSQIGTHRTGEVGGDHPVAGMVAELFISTKTASVHVSNILRKLGLRSRIQAAALAHRRRL